MTSSDPIDPTPPTAPDSIAGEAYVASIMAGLPLGASATRTHEGWRVVRGAQCGEGKTLARAVLTLGASRGPNPASPNQLVWLTESGDVLSPE